MIVICTLIYKLALSSDDVRRGRDKEKEKEKEKEKDEGKRLTRSPRIQVACLWEVSRELFLSYCRLFLYTLQPDVRVSKGRRGGEGRGGE